MYGGVITWFRRHDTRCQWIFCNTLWGGPHLRDPSQIQTNLGVSGSYGKNIFWLSPWCPPAALSDLWMFSMNRWLHLSVTDRDCIGLRRPDGDLNTVASRRWLFRHAGCLMVQFSAQHILGSGVKRSISVLNSCKASTPGGRMVLCCFTLLRFHNILCIHLL